MGPLVRQHDFYVPEVVEDEDDDNMVSGRYLPDGERPCRAEGGLLPLAATTKTPSAGGRQCGVSTQEEIPSILPTSTEGSGPSRPTSLFKHVYGGGTTVPRTGTSGLGSLRQRTAGVRDSLVGIHPNPGPNGRNERRSERRREWRRRDRIGVASERERKSGCMIVTWNVQGASMRESNRRRLRKICERAAKENWEIVLVSEVRAKEDGVIWLGEGEKTCVIVHGKKAAVLLRGRAVRMWVEEGQRKWFGERVTAVVLGGMRLVAVYQPVWGTDEGGMERYRRDLVGQLGMGKRERIVIGGILTRM